MTNTDKMITKIGNLLRQAEGTDNLAEAEAFTEAAQRLATAHAVDLELARTAAGQRDRRPQPVIKQVHMGTKGTKGLRTYVALFLAIARANDVRCDIASNSTYVVAYGDDTDIEWVQTLYAALLLQMVRACEAYLAAGEWRGQTVLREVRRGDRWSGYYTDVQETALSRVTARLQFQEAFAERIGDRLQQARAESVEAAEVEAQSSSVALVLKGKEVRVTEFYQAHSGARGSWRGACSNAHSSHARGAGSAAAAAASLDETSSTSLSGARRAVGA